MNKWNEEIHSSRPSLPPSPLSLFIVYVSVWSAFPFSTSVASVYQHFSVEHQHNIYHFYKFNGPWQQPGYATSHIPCRYKTHVHCAQLCTCHTHAHASQLLSSSSKSKYTEYGVWCSGFNWQPLAGLAFHDNSTSTGIYVSVKDHREQFLRNKLCSTGLTI